MEDGRHAEPHKDRNVKRRRTKTFSGSLQDSRAVYDTEMLETSAALSKILEERVRPHSWSYLLYALLGPLLTFAMDYAAYVVWPMKDAFVHPDTW